METFADQAVIAIENVRLFTELQEKNRALTQAHTQVTESLEQQTATSEILRVIASSPTDVLPVFDAILKAAVRLCGGSLGAVYRYDGRMIDFVSHHNFSPAGVEMVRAAFPMPASQRNSVGRAILDRSVIHVIDLQHDSDAPIGDVMFARAEPHHSVVAVPMLRDGMPLGAMALARGESAFTERHIALLKTFADQAVIAIENVRLFNETKEALDRETATAEILRVIASSPTDLQPVLDAVAESAARLCDAEDFSIVETEGEVFRVVAFRGARQLRDFGGTPVNRDSVAGRAILDGQLVHVHDITEEAEYPVSKAFAQRVGHRTMLATPLLREGTPIGAVFVRRTDVRPFSDNQIELLKTFADQAVIAIENVRLFTELQASNRELRTALDTQTATSEILGVISRSQTDVQPVFDAIVASALRLLGGTRAP